MVDRQQEKADYAAFVRLRDLEYHVRQHHTDLVPFMHELPKQWPQPPGFQWQLGFDIERIGLVSEYQVLVETPLVPPLACKEEDSNPVFWVSLKDVYCDKIVNRRLALGHQEAVEAIKALRNQQLDEIRRRDAVDMARMLDVMSYSSMRKMDALIECIQREYPELGKIMDSYKTTGIVQIYVKDILLLRVCSRSKSNGDKYFTIWDDQSSINLELIEVVVRHLEELIHLRLAEFEDRDQRRVDELDAETQAEIWRAKKAWWTRHNRKKRIRHLTLPIIHSSP